jgi:outer membrane biosynthesis protein TonB
MKYSSRGLIGTIITHALLVLILIFFGFSYPDPPPMEQGVLVNFGTDETGLGDIEPAGDETQGGKEETKVEAVEAVKVTPTVPVKPKTQKTVVSKATQNLEEVKVKEVKPTEEELKQIELQKAEAEQARVKKAEEERQRQVTEQMNAKAKNAFGNKGVGTGTGGQGITEGNGNQGSLEGTAGAPNYGPGGGLGNGEGFGLGGRGIRGTLPKPLVSGCTVTSRIIVKVQITVDREGNVTDQKILESNFQDDCIYLAVQKAALLAKFTVDQQASFRQQGWIRYIIEP